MKPLFILLFLFGGGMGAVLMGRTQVTPSDVFFTGFLLGLAVVSAIREGRKNLP